MESRLNYLFSCVPIRPNEWSFGTTSQGWRHLSGRFRTCSLRTRGFITRRQNVKRIKIYQQKKNKWELSPIHWSQITHFFFCGQRNESLFFFRDVSHYSKMDQPKLNLLIIAAIIWCHISSEDDSEMAPLKALRGNVSWTMCCFTRRAHRCGLTEAGLFRQPARLTALRSDRGQIEVRSRSYHKRTAPDFADSQTSCRGGLGTAVLVRLSLSYRPKRIALVPRVWLGRPKWCQYKNSLLSPLIRSKRRNKDAPVTIWYCAAICLSTGHRLHGLRAPI